MSVVILGKGSKGKSYAEYQADKTGTSWKGKLKIAVDALIPQVSDFEELISRLQAMGYEIKPGKYVSCRAPGQERFTRLKTLGADYTEEGTVKSRLSTGRSQMKKGLETMETRENYLPGRLNLPFGGSDGLKGETISLVEEDLIAQNLLNLAYDKPITISDLSKAIGIPAAYIEPIVKKLIDGELMVQMDSGKVYSDFIISKAQDILKNFESQKNFAHKQFDTVWNIVEKMSDKISKMDFVKSMDSEEIISIARNKCNDYFRKKATQYEIPRNEKLIDICRRRNKSYYVII